MNTLTENRILNQLFFIREGGNVERFHTVRTIKPETVGHHSFLVAWFCWLLANENPSVNLIMSALSHDLAEHIMGDVPSPTKRALDISEKLALVEAGHLGSAGLLFELTAKENRTLKIADIFSGMMFCIQERYMGNRVLVEVFLRYSSYLVKLKPLSSLEEDIDSLIQRLWRRVDNG